LRSSTCQIQILSQSSYSALGQQAIIASSLVIVCLLSAVFLSTGLLYPAQVVLLLAFAIASFRILDANKKVFLVEGNPHFNTNFCA
jgi:hypothetical protein